MPKTAEQPVIDFHMYPSVGTDDWRYTFQAAQVRALEMQMLTKATLLDMTNADSFESAAALLSSSEYALPHGGRNFAEIEETLQTARTQLRELYNDHELKTTSNQIPFMPPRSRSADGPKFMRRSA